MENPLNCQIISEKIEPILKFVRYGGVKGPGIRIQITGVQRSVNIRVCGPDAAYTGRFVAAEELVSVVEKVAHREHQSQTRGVEIKRFEKRDIQRKRIPEPFLAGKQFEGFRRFGQLPGDARRASYQRRFDEPIPGPCGLRLYAPAFRTVIVESRETRQLGACCRPSSRPCSSWRCGPTPRCSRRHRP